jgi:hypothetical protein
MASNALAHLLPSTRALAGLVNAQRLHFLQRDRWIDYPRATEALQRLERLRQMPQRERMPCLVLHGKSNIGKTLIIAKFLRDHPPQFNESRDAERREIISLQMPATPDQRRFYSALLFELGAPQSATATLASLERVARDLLRRFAPRMLIVDEVHHLLAGSHLEQRASLNLLKYLANDLKISIVAVGTADAPLALQTDPQMSSRFTPFEIPCWTESEDFRRLLRSFEQGLPLRKSSDLAQRPIVQFLIAATSGLLGEISRILTEAAEHAIHDGSGAFPLSSWSAWPVS